MNLSDITVEFKYSLQPKWFVFNNSSLKISSIKSSENFKLISKNQILSTNDLALLMSNDIVHDWRGIKDQFGKDIEFSQHNAFNALSKDLNFLKLVVEIAFNPKNFVEANYGR